MKPATYLMAAAAFALAALPAVAADKALFTTMAVLGAAVSALPVLRSGFAVRSLQEYAQDRAERLAGAGR